MNRLKNLAITLLAALAALGCSDTLRAQNVLTVTPSSLTFNNALDGTTSPAQQVSISWNQPSTGTAVVQASQSWILLNGMPTLTSVNFSNTPAVLNVSVNPQNLPAGNYSGTVTVTTGNGSAMLSQIVSVSMTVTGTSLLSAAPASLSFTAAQGSNTGAPGSTPVTITSSGQALSFALSVQTQGQTGNWLLLSNSCSQTAPCATGSTSQFSEIGRAHV